MGRTNNLLPKDRDGLIPIHSVALPSSVINKIDEIRQGHPRNRIIIRILEQALGLSPYDFDWHYKEMRKRAKEREREQNQIAKDASKKVNIKNINV